MSRSWSPWEEAIRTAVLEIGAGNGITAEQFRQRYRMSKATARETLNRAAQTGALEKYHTATEGRCASKSAGAIYSYRVPA